MAKEPPLARAARLATKADRLLSANETKKAWKLYAEAARVTEDALATPALGERGLGISLTNAAVLWVKAQEFKRAEALACRYLVDDSAVAVRGTLRHVLNACWQAQTVLQPDNDYFTPIELGLEGNDIGFGVAPVDEVTRRQDTVQALLWRATEYEAGVAYRPRGSPHQLIRAAAQVYAAAPAPGSYKVVLKVKSPRPQLPLFADQMEPEARAVGGEPLVQRAIRLVKAIASGAAEAAKEITHPLYRVSLAKLVRDLAPDGKRVSSVEISGGTVRVAARIEAKDRPSINEGIKHAFAEAGLVEIQGELVGMELRDKVLAVSVRDRDDKKFVLTAPRGEGFEEKVGPLWGRQVSVAARHDAPSHYALQDVEVLAATEAPE